jgi:hypothetical protein
VGSEEQVSSRAGLRQPGELACHLESADKGWEMSTRVKVAVIAYPVALIVFAFTPLDVLVNAIDMILGIRADNQVVVTCEADGYTSLSTGRVRLHDHELRTGVHNERPEPVQVVVIGAGTYARPVFVPAGRE